MQAKRFARYAVPDGTLRKLVEHEDRAYLRIVAECEATPPDILRRLIERAEASLRREVASRPGLPAELVELLAQDKDSSVLEVVAKRDELPLAAVEHLASSDNWRCWLAAARRPFVDRLPRAAQKALLACEQTDVSEALADNPRFPVDVFSQRVRLAVACHPNSEPKAIRVLSLDHDPEVKKAATSHPRWSKPSFWERLL